jgi:glycosyltransferase involved in cell wall biosynthesis
MLEKPLPLVYRKAPIVAVSRSTAADLQQRGFKNSQIEIIPNGVDLGFYSPSPAVAKSPIPVVLYLGRLKRYKRVDLIIRAFARVWSARRQARLIIAGQGNARPELEKLVAGLGIAEAVSFAGFVTEEQKRELFRSAWVHMLTSSKEGWGITNIEAAACGTPTIASDAPGLRDSVEHGVTGFLVPHGDVSAIETRLQEVIDNPQLRSTLSRQAISFAQQFAWQATAVRMESFLQNAMRSARG